MTEKFLSSMTACMQMPCDTAENSCV